MKQLFNLLKNKYRMSIIANDWLCLFLSASITHLGLKNSQITYNTKLTLPEASIKQVFISLDTYTSDVNNAEHLLVFFFIS